jgi:hypothetical protein
MQNRRIYANTKVTERLPKKDLDWNARFLQEQKLEDIQMGREERQELIKEISSLPKPQPLHWISLMVKG